MHMTADQPTSICYHVHVVISHEVSPNFNVPRTDRKCLMADKMGTSWMGSLSDVRYLSNCVYCIFTCKFDAMEPQYRKSILVIFFPQHVGTR